MIDSCSLYGFANFIKFRELHLETQAVLAHLMAFTFYALIDYIWTIIRAPLSCIAYDLNPMTDFKKGLIFLFLFSILGLGFGRWAHMFDGDFGFWVDSWNHFIYLPKR